MVISTESPLEEHLQKDYDDVVVYADPDGTEILHEGSVRILATGWVELPTGRLLSPGAVHHIDRQA